MRTGILSAARAEGYREGWAQAAQIVSDADYERGRRYAEAEVPSWKRWFMAGWFVGTALACLWPVLLS